MGLTCGYFDAQWDSNLEDYDIKYTSSDFNRYLKGIIEQNGVFKNIRTIASPGSTETSKTPFEIEIGQGLEVYVHSGKAMVNGHWVELTDGQTVSFAKDESDLVNHPGPDPTVTRRDGIVLRYDQNNRTITLTNKTGKTSTTGLVDIWPAGYNFNKDVKKFFGVDEHGIAEIMLAWVDIKPNTTQLSSDMITSRIGNSECPWISHLVLNSKDPDVDTYLAMMKDSFDAWFHDTQERLQINTNVVRYYKTVYSHTGSTSTTISLGNMKVVPSFEDVYKIEDGDIVTVYYNGLAIIDNTNNKNWTLFNDNGTPKITLNWIPQNSSGQSVIPKGNGVDIVIEKSRLGGIKNCINEYY